MFNFVKYKSYFHDPFMKRFKDKIFVDKVGHAEHSQSI